MAKQAEPAADKADLEPEAQVQPEEVGEAETPESETPDVEQLRQALEEAQAKAGDNWDKLLRAQAEIENLRKRAARDLENAHKYGLEKFAGELLPVKDSLELGLSAGSEVGADKLIEGTQLTLKMLTQALEKFDIEEIDPQGEPFDPQHHQAMTLQESGELEPNTVTTVMQKGYLLNDRLLRPAMVIVSKAPDSEEDS
ncbi:MAG: nucleotide exchange factor GrpE [Gammaproteobacteria bacterium]